MLKRLIGSMSRALDALHVWMSSNRLRLNPTETQLIWLGTPQQLSKIDLASLTLKYPHFTFLTTVRDLGVILDPELTQHITHKSTHKSALPQLLLPASSAQGNLPLFDPQRCLHAGPRFCGLTP